MGRDQKRTIVFLKTVFLIFLAAGFFMAHVWVRTRTVTLGYELQKQRKTLSDLEEYYFNLQIQEQKIRKCSSLEELNNSLSWGLKNPRNEQIHFLAYRANP
ncbi:MAG: hypothetical protein KA116_09000 [Proteobacteria bacterium]|nr:hypothetical protein [Pseudomonadota bacterium]